MDQAGIRKLSGRVATNHNSLEHLNTWLNNQPQRNVISHHCIPGYEEELLPHVVIIMLKRLDLYREMNLYICQSLRSVPVAL